MKTWVALLSAKLLALFEDARIRVPVTMLFLYVLFLLRLSLVERYPVRLEGGVQETLTGVLAVIISLVVYVLTLYTVFSQEENDLLTRRDAVLKLLRECSTNRDVCEGASEVLRAIEEILVDASRTLVRWLVYELPYAYTLVLPLALSLHLYATVQPGSMLALLLPQHISWDKILVVFAGVLLSSGAALGYVFRRGYERRFLRLQALATKCLRDRVSLGRHDRAF